MSNANNVFGPNGATPTFNGGASFVNLTTSANTQIKTGAGVFQGIVVNTVGTTSTLAAYDGTSSSVTWTLATPGVVTWTKHGLAAGTAVKFSGGTLPTGIALNTSYFVANDTNLTANTFAVSDTFAHATASPATNQVATSGSQSAVIGWNANNPIGTLTTVAQANIPIGAACTLGLFVITAGGAAANLTVLYV